MQPDPLTFFADLVWLDGRPLLDTVEAYRRRMFAEALYTFDPDGRPHYDRVVRGVAKKNYKTTDLSLAALYRFLMWESPAGNDCFILANDEGQASDDLSLIKKLIAVNPILDREVKVYNKEIARQDGKGVLKILPAQDAIGAHGKTYLFAGFDEIHGYRNYDLFEALSPDPTRRDVLTWITSYAGIRHAPGIPLYDLMQVGKAGTDPRLYFSWYAADYTTDHDLQGDDVSPEQRANPSMSSWDVADYLDQQRARLPSHKFRRLHLNLPGAPDGAAFSGEHVMAAIVPGRRVLPRQPHISYQAFVDMSGGSNDDACLAIAHREGDRAVLDLLVSQTGRPPFNPSTAVDKFVDILQDYGIPRVWGDSFAGQTFAAQFRAHGVSYSPAVLPKSDIYEQLEPKLNAGLVELLDLPELQEQLLTLVWRGTKIDHQSGDHDDHANAAAGAIYLCIGKSSGRWFKSITPAVIERARFGYHPDPDPPANSNAEPSDRAERYRKAIARARRMGPAWKKLG